MKTRSSAVGRSFGTTVDSAFVSSRSCLVYVILVSARREYVGANHSYEHNGHIVNGLSGELPFVAPSPSRLADVFVINDVDNSATRSDRRIE